MFMMIRFIILLIGKINCKLNKIIFSHRPFDLDNVFNDRVILLLTPTENETIDMPQFDQVGRC